MAQKGKPSGPKTINSNYLLVLTNPRSANYFTVVKGYLLDAFANELKANAEVKIISALSELNNFLTADLNLAKALFFLINVELYWDDIDLQGYKIALELMQNKLLDEKPINIYFTSFAAREFFFDSGTGINKYFSKTFEHTQLPFETGDLKLKFAPILPAKWDFIKKYALTESGILDRLLHDLRPYLTQSRDDLDVVVSQFNERIRAISEIAGSDLIEHLGKFDTIRSVSNHLVLQDYLAKMNGLLAKRIIELSPAKAAKLALDSTRRFKILLLEDDIKEAEHLKEMFSPFFEIVPFEDGEEALLELERYGKFYHAIIIDLELLDKTKKLDQKIQGVEVFEYAKKQLPHIVKKVITGLPSKGVSELLNISTKDILRKQHLLTFGQDELVVDFILRLESDIKRHLTLVKLRGPNSTFWADFSRQGGDGGMFKRFYHKLKLEKESRFNNMWKEIRETLKLIESDPNAAKISTEFKKTEDAKGIVDNIDEEETIEFLKTLLLHRLIIIEKYSDGSTMYYRSDRNKERSFSDFPFWAGTLPANPKVYMFYLGFGVDKMQPKDPKAEDTLIHFSIKYNQLFDEEIVFIKEKPALVLNRFSDFYQDHEDFCEIIDYALTSINEHQEDKRGRQYFFQKYPKQLDNLFEMTESYAKEILEALLRENSINIQTIARENVRSLFYEFTYGTWVDTEWTEEFSELPKYLQKNILGVLEKI
jgi:hypothetical protein